MEINRIVAGIDLGPDTEKVLAYAAAFAGISGASVNLIYALDYLITPPAYLIPYVEGEKSAAAGKMGTWEKLLNDAGVRTRKDVISGRLCEAFESAVKARGADMLVVGFGTHALRRSSSEKLIKGIGIPTLVAKGDKTGSAKIGSVAVRDILCPVDFSEASDRALEAASQLTIAFSSQLKVLHVLPVSVIMEKLTPLKDRAMKELMGQARDRLDRLQPGPETESIIDEGEPYRRIASFASERDIDLIVMGARGQSPIKNISIGSVTEAVLKSSPCPVLIIR